VYPTYIAAPVGAEQMQPPASQSNVTGDFLGNGGSLTVSHRHLRVNQAMRAAAADMQAPLIDVERYWFQAMATNGEAALFNAGQTVHPNQLGHVQSYHWGIDDFLCAMALDKQQAGHELNLEFTFGPQTVQDGSRWQNRSPWETSYHNAQWDGKDARGYIQNVSTPQNITVPDGAGEIRIFAFNGQQASQAMGYAWKSWGAVTLVPVWSSGSGVFSVSASGMDIIITPAQANTYISWTFEQW